MLLLHKQTSNTCGCLAVNKLTTNKLGLNRTHIKVTEYSIE